MARFSASDAAFEGLRLVRERPAAFLVWAVLAFLFSVLTGAVMVTVAGAALAELSQTMNSGSEPDPQEIARVMSVIGPAYGLLMPISLGYYAVMYGAVNRAVLQPQEGGVGFLKVGVQELRQLGVTLLVWLIIFGLYMGGFILIALLAAIAAAADSGVAAALLAIVGVFLVLGAMLFAGVRLSLANPLAFDRRQIDIPAAWRMTKGRFWALFGAYLLAFMLIAIVWIAVFLIFAAAAAVIGGGISSVGAVFRPDTSSLGTYFTPVMLLYHAFNSLVTALAIATFAGAAADAYRQLTSRDEATMERAIAAG